MAGSHLQLKECFRGRVCLLGVGNVDLGDDGFGVALAEELEKAGLDVFVAGTTPERFIGRIVAQGFQNVIFLDAVEFGAEPGAVVFLNSAEMAARFPQISTHKLSLGLLAQWVEKEGKTKAWLLGVQPESLRSGQGLTPTVQRTLEALQELVRELYEESACYHVNGRVSQEHCKLKIVNCKLQIETPQGAGQSLAAPINTPLQCLSLPTSFSHMHQASFYSCKTLGKLGQFALCSSNRRAARGAVGNPPDAKQGAACFADFVTCSCIATYIISVT